MNGGSLTSSMNDTCLFKLIYHSNDRGKLQVSHRGGDRVHTIIDNSKATKSGFTFRAPD